MVLIYADSESQTLYIPIPVPDAVDNISLKARSTTEGVEVSFNIVRSESVGYILQALIDTPQELFAGEWEYTLAYETAEGEEFTATGLMMAYLKDAPEAKQYNEEIQYKQYGE